GATGSNLSFVFWSTNRGHAGFAQGTNSFTASIPLETGSNLVTITAVDGVGNQGKIFPPIDASPAGPPPPPPQSLSALGAAKLWVGLPSTTDFGIKFDLRSEELVNGSVVGSGQINGVAAGFSTSSTGAKLNSIPQSLSGGPVALTSGDVVSIRILARNACWGSMKSAGTARLWFNGKQVDTGFQRDTASRFAATIGGARTAR